MSDPFKAPPPMSPAQQALIDEFNRLDTEWDVLTMEQRITQRLDGLKEALAKAPDLIEKISSAYGPDAFFSAVSHIHAVLHQIEQEEMKRNRITLKYVPLPQEGIAFWAVVYHPGTSHVDGHRWWDTGGSILATFATNPEAFDTMLRCASRMQATPSFDSYPDGNEPEDPVYFTLTGDRTNEIHRGKGAHITSPMGVRMGARVMNMDDPRISLDVRTAQINVGAHLPVDDDGHRPEHWGLTYNRETGVETWPIVEAPLWWLEPWGLDPNWVAPPPDPSEWEDDQDTAAA